MGKDTFATPEQYREAKKTIHDTQKQLYEQAEKAVNQMTDKLYTPCDDCKFDEDSPDCQRCEFEQALSDNVAVQRLLVGLSFCGDCLLENQECINAILDVFQDEFKAHFTPSKVSEMLDAIAAKDEEIKEAWAQYSKAQAEIERLKGERDALGKAIRYNAVKTGNCNENASLTGPHLIMLVSDMGSEIATLRTANESLSKSLELANDDAVDLMIDKDRLIAEHAEERRLKDETRRRMCREMSRRYHGSAESYAKSEGWGYLYEKEQGK
jgi:hypothetical protein